MNKHTPITRINSSGPARALLLADGWYVVGRGVIFAVDSVEEAVSEAAEIEAQFGDSEQKDVNS
jgi:hypothetical protein